MNDEHYMQMALELAVQGRGYTSPNPMVGAVVVRNGAVVGRGFHQSPGGPHAEVHAIDFCIDQLTIEKARDKNYIKEVIKNGSLN